ncbi:hypothetical protein [Flagellimonas sp. W118]|uniref:hypothetical protein n=1 Tax=Flagellimonas sp. W118 TaxID=3410791 RepID=UPI003BF53CB6
MPALSAIKQTQTYSDLLVSLIRTPGNLVDQTYMPNEEVNFSDACDQTDSGHGEWVGVTVSCQNFAIGEETGGSGALGNDDPQYVGVCISPSPTVSRSLEYTDSAEKDPKWVTKDFGAYSPLNQSDKVRFGVITNAFNNDSTEAWEGIVKALGSDMTTAMTLGITALPGLAQITTVGAIGEAITKWVSDALTNDPDDLGTVDICDSINPIKWYAKTDKDTWTARKWAVHTVESNPTSGWYLSQWFITLSKKVERYEIRDAPISELYSSLQKSDFKGLSNDMILAGLKATMGGDVNVIAEKHGIKPIDVYSAQFALRSATDGELSALVNRVLIDKLG